MNSCANCGHAIFDAKWGEYKCEIKKRTVYNGSVIDITISCEDHTPGTPKESKKNADYEASL